MSQFNPRRVLRQISPPLLKEFFERQKQPLDVKWDDRSNAKADDIFDAWQRLPDGPRKDIEMVFHDIDEIAKGDEGLKVIHEEAMCHGENLAVLLEPMESRYDRAMWTCLNRPQIWDAAVRFAKADSLSLGRFWIKRGNVPKAEPRTDNDGRRELADAMSAFFREQGRGHYCRVDHFSRGQGHDYFFVYLSDYANTHVNFDDGGNFRRTTERRAFEVVFAYDRENGALELYAKGGHKVIEPLQNLFCQIILGRKLKPENPDVQPYSLDSLLDKGFAFDTDPEDGIEAVSVRGLRLSIIGRKRGRITLEADPEKGRDCIYEMLEEDLNRKRLPKSVLQVTKATLHFKLNGNGHGRSLTFNVSAPNTCDLKSKREEQRLLGEKYLRRWKIDVV